LLPTIRSRAIPLHLGPLSTEEVERLLAPMRWTAEEKRLAAQLAEGSGGAARRLDLEESRRLRHELLALLRHGLEARDFTGLFARTQSLAQARQETLEKLLALFYSLLHDILYLVVSRETGAPSHPLRNLDLEKELSGIARQVDWEWLVRAASRLDKLDGLLRRNINRQVALEALAMSLESVREQ
jgi:DNA polymerase-3 subunit delta'